MNTTVTYDVLIAGGRPVGLFLACELRLAGVSVLLLERNQNPSTPLKSGWMCARGLNFPSTEAFYRRALHKDVKEASFGWMGGERPGKARIDNKPVLTCWLLLVMDRYEYEGGEREKCVDTLDLKI